MQGKCQFKPTLTLLAWGKCTLYVYSGTSEFGANGFAPYGAVVRVPYQRTEIMSGKF